MNCPHCHRSSDCVVESTHDGRADWSCTFCGHAWSGDSFDAELAADDRALARLVGGLLLALVSAGALALAALW